MAEKQLTLRNEFLDVNLKKEYSLDDDHTDGWDNSDNVDKIGVEQNEATQEMTIDCPISMFKNESDTDEKDEQEMPTADLMDTVISTDEKDIIAPDSVAVNNDIDEEEDDDDDDHDDDFEARDDISSEGKEEVFKSFYKKNCTEVSLQ